jgi:hypothetical protein
MKQSAKQSSYERADDEGQAALTTEALLLCTTHSFEATEQQMIQDPGLGLLVPVSSSAESFWSFGWLANG